MIKDLLTDVANAYLKGVIAKQYPEAVELARPFVERFTQPGLGYKIILTGHSLGGGLASYATIKLANPLVSAIVFNSAGLDDDLLTESRPVGSSGALTSVTTLNWKIASITNIHLVGDPVALFPGQQTGTFYLLTVPEHFVWFDDSGKQIQKFSTLAAFVKTFGVDVAFLPGVDKLVPEGWFAPLVGDANYIKLLISDYAKLLSDHRGIDVRSLPLEPHLMINVITALQIRVATK